MRIIRYLNGVPLHGDMPVLLLGQQGIVRLIAAAAQRKQLPLPDAAPPAILEMDQGGFGKEIR